MSEQGERTTTRRWSAEHFSALFDPRGVIVAGCLPERVGGSLRDELPEIDHIVGVWGRDEINRVADRLVGGMTEQRELFRPAPIRAQDDRARLRITPQHFAYLKISEGCDRTCTFCAIPKMRGKHVTKPIELTVEFLGEGKDPWGGTRIGVEATGQLSRKDWGIDFNIPLEGDKVMIGDKITINIVAEAVLQA